MNERIKELAEQSLPEFYLTNCPSALEKFAELIVKECLMLNAKELSAAAQFRMFDIYWDHFGLKE